MTKVKLFQQKPKIEKFKPSPRLRAVDNTDLDRKGELEKFRRWLEGTAKQKSGLPKKKELDKLNNEVSKGRVNKFGLLGILGALPLVGPLLGIGGGALASVATGAIAAISGGLVTAGGLAVGGGLKLFGLGAVAAGGGAKLFGKKIFGGGAKPGVTPQTPKVSPRPASSPPRSNAAGNQVSPGQTARTNSNRATKPGQTPKGVTQPKRPSARARLGSQMETGTAFGGKGSQAQKKLFKLQSKLKKMFSGKNPMQGFLSKIFGTKAGRKGIGMFLKKFVLRIPFIGALIDFALNVFVFKENPKRALFKAIGAGLGAWIGGGVGAFLGGGFASWITAPIGAFLGGAGGDAFGSWVYDSIFGNPSASASAPDPKGEGNILDELLGGDAAAGELPAPGEPPAQPLSGRVSTTGSGNGPLVDVISQKAMTETYGVPTGPVRTRGRSGGHGGVDIGTGSQTGYYVAYRRSGTVSLVRSLSGYGNTVIIKIGNLDFLFAHLARKSDLKPGQPYNGEIIGEIGNTGRTFGGGGQHLHFEVRPAGGGGGSDINPEPYVSSLVIGRLDPNSEQSRVGGVESGAEKLNAAGQIEEEKPKSFIEKLTDMLPESAKSAMSGVIESFKIFGYMADKELMDSLVVNPDGSVSKVSPEEKKARHEKTLEESLRGFRGIEMENSEDSLVVNEDNTVSRNKPAGGLDTFTQGISMDSIVFPKKDFTVEMLSPEAEALLNNSIIMMQGQPSIQMMSGGGGTDPIAIAPMPPQQPVIVLGGHQDTLAAVKLLQAHALS